MLLMVKFVAASMPNTGHSRCAATSSVTNAHHAVIRNAR